MDDPFHRGLTEFRWVNTTLLRDYVGRFPALETHLEMTHERESRDLRPATVFAPVLRTMLTDAIKGLVPLETLKRALNGGVGLMRKAAMPGGTVDFFDPSSDAGSVSLQRLRYPTMSTTPLLPRLALTTTTVQLLNVIPTTVLWEQLLQLAAYQMMLLDDFMQGFIFQLVRQKWQRFTCYAFYTLRCLAELNPSQAGKSACSISSMLVLTFVCVKMLM